MTTKQKGIAYFLVITVFIMLLYPLSVCAESSPLATLCAGDSYTVNVNVASAGDYYICAEYKALEGYGEDIIASVSVNGEKSDAVYTFDRFYRNDIENGNDFLVEYDGDQICPEQQEIFIRTKINFDNVGEILGLSLGVNEITIQLLADGIELYAIDMRPYCESPEYKEYIREHERSVVNKKIIIEGEKAELKSNSGLVPTIDRASAETSPASASTELLNTIGGASWKKSGQWISWNFTVEESGLYEMSFRFRQNINIGMNSYRRVYIDGVTPFKELYGVSFPSSNSWQRITLGDDDGSYYIYLEKGEHTIRLESVQGQYASIVEKSKTLLNELNSIYRSIIAITGVEPDVYRDYSIKDTAPEILTNLKDCAAELQTLEKELTTITATSNEGSGILKQLYERMELMSEKHRKIASNLSDFKSGISSMGTWINNMDSHPLELDYIVLGSESGEIFSRVGFWERIKYMVARFADTFAEDYDIMDAGFESKVTVWIGTGNIAGIDQMKILNSVISNSFQPKYNIGVDLKLTAPSALLSATLAGIGPDVALQMAGSAPVDYGLRNAVVNLYEFADVKEVLKRFSKSAYETFSFNGKLYALPETQSYSMLFYRKDILESLGIDIGSLKTWKDIWQDVLPELQRQYMDFGFIPSAENYLMLLYQRGGELYLDDGRSCGLSSESAVEAFDEFTMLYDSYGLPITFDFLNRFRTGEMPLAVADFTVYNQLSVFAPEIKELWAMTTLPGTCDKEGNINTTAVATSMGCVMMADAEDKEAAWTFMKWWTDEEAQHDFGNRIEELLGDAARYPTANLEAFSRIKWGAENRATLNKQRKNVVGIEQVAGGYITARFFEFSFRDVVYDGKDVRETLNDAVRKIDHEISKKREEFDID